MSGVKGGRTNGLRRGKSEPIGARVSSAHPSAQIFLMDGPSRSIRLDRYAMHPRFRVRCLLEHGPAGPAARDASEDR